MKKFILSILIILVLFVNLSESKYMLHKFNTKRIIKNGFEYFTKFGMDIGSGAFKVRFKLERKVNKYLDNKIDGDSLELDFLILLDKEYEKIEPSMTCEQKYKFVQKKIKAKINTDGSWSKEYKQTLTQKQRQHMWYFALGGCGNSIQVMEKYGFQVYVEFTALNSDESQFSCEESGMLTIYTLTFLGSLGGIIYLYAMYAHMKERDWAVIYLITSLILFFFSAFFYFLHLTYYAYDGEGSFFFRFFSTLSNSASQIVITLLLVQMAWGWTITFEEIPDKEVIVPLFMAITVVDLLIMGLGFVNDGSDLKFHSYSGWVGYTIITIRLLIFAYFAYSIQTTLGKAKEKIREFGKKLQFFGSVYFLSLPIAVFIGSLLAYYLQHRFITIFNMGIQIFAIVFLGLNFLSKDSGYQKVAIKNRTELPSAFGSKFE